MKKTPATAPKPKGPSVFGLLGPYRTLIAALVVFSIASNASTLVLPLLISRGITAYSSGLDIFPIVLIFLGASIFIFLFTCLQTIVQTYAAERVARDMRQNLISKISKQNYRFIEKANPSKLLTNLTSDIDSIKNFVSMAIVSLVSSAIIIVGAAIILLVIDWRLALVVLTIVPIIGGVFFVVLGQVRKLFLKSREVIDWLNRVINESILGAALIRVLHSEAREHDKFIEANTDARNIGLNILRLFSIMIPFITFVSNAAVLAVLLLGGHFVIAGSMSLGNFAAFNSYIAILIFPILIIGFMSNVIAQANASYSRISEVLGAPDAHEDGEVLAILDGDVEVKDLTISYGEKAALKNISFKVAPGERTAIIGPTAAGKTQLLYALVGLIAPTSGEILYDGIPLENYQSEQFYRQIGFVFQDSILFNMSVKENIAFSDSVTDESLALAIDTAELSDFIHALPEGLETIVSERGSSLSGGQKQRIMLARALAQDPKILYLDDFTARVDSNTEAKILANVAKNYPHLTLVSVTQKIAPIEHYGQIILLMEGEILARGTHDELMSSSPEYVQIYESQKSTNHYELQS